MKNADTQAFDSDAWKFCGSKRKLADIVASGRRRCYVGLDLSSGGDLTSLVLEFERTETDPWYVYSHSFMPAGRLAEHIATDTAPYDLWAAQGLITATGSETSFMTDYDYILGHLRELRDRYELEFAGIGIDPHNASALMLQLEEFSCPVVQITQSARSLNEATTELQGLVKSREVEYDQENELLTWSILNATTVQNSFKEVKLDKKVGAKTRRIDVADAYVDAHALIKLQGGGEELSTAIRAGLEDYLNYFGGKKK